MRPRFCIDASVLGRWLFSDADVRNKVEALLAGYQAGEVDLCAPDLVISEVGNLLTAAQRNGYVDSAEALEALEHIDALGLRLIPAWERAPEALLTATTLGLSFYDALYVAVAEAEACTLLTADLRLARRIEGTKPFVTSLDDFTWPPTPCPPPTS